jgi:hypothetical protein
VSLHVFELKTKNKKLKHKILVQNLVLLTMSLKSLSSELVSLWATSYGPETVNKACTLECQLTIMKDGTDGPDTVSARKALAKHDACLALHNLLLGDWWRSENFERLHYLMDDVADAFNNDYMEPIPLWSHVYTMICKHKGGSANMHWTLSFTHPS